MDDAQWVAEGIVKYQGDWVGLLKKIVEGEDVSRTKDT
jgi:hypothetical protein